MKKSILILMTLTLLSCDKSNNPVSVDSTHRVNCIVVFQDTLKNMAGWPIISQPGTMLRWRVYNLGPDTMFNVSARIYSTDSIPLESSIWRSIGNIYVPKFNLCPSWNYYYNIYLTDKLNPNPAQNPDKGYWYILTRLDCDYKIEIEAIVQ